MFVRNCWYVAAWSEEVQSKLLARTILGEPVVMYRTSDGAVHALQDRCAHRCMPLSKGAVIDDNVVCCYHGLTYAPSGACVRIPGATTVPASLKVASYTVHERYGAVWIWMGDPAQADPASIFACAGVDEQGGGHHYYFPVRANYLLVNDNLSDLLHQAYLHNPSFGGNATPLGEFRPRVHQQEQEMDVSWEWNGIEAPALFGEVGSIAGTSDGWNRSHFRAPSFYINRVGFARAGTGGIDSPLPQGDGKLSLVINQLITPETERTTHFFKIVHCPWPERLVPQLDRFIVNVNKEDIWACEAQQQVIDSSPGAEMHAIPTDVPVVQMHRIVDRLIAAERTSRS
jgi:vanillate O-demethylase monooxygenase subunit